VAAKKSAADLLRETFVRMNVESREVQKTDTTITFLRTERALNTARKQAGKPPT
jgi:hypothetical protein